MRWHLQIRYDFWAEAIHNWYGRGKWSFLDWRWHRTTMLQEQFLEDKREMIQLYCMGGEL